jgi:hypothetical protein
MIRVSCTSSLLVKAFLINAIFVSACFAQQTKTAPAQKAAPVAVAPAPAPEAAPSRAEVVVPSRAPVVTDSMIQAKLDSLSRAAENSAISWDTTKIQDSTAKLRKAVQQGKYIDRTSYDKSNFDHWKVDSVLQANQKKRVGGNWRTDILEHGHAFRDATIRFANNDTLYSTTYTYTDSGRYMKTGEYAYRARYRFESDSTFRSREVFADRNVVRWDYVKYHVKGDTLKHHLYKLEFRDLMDNWLDAIQEFESVAPEVYHRSQDAIPAKQKGKS